MHRRRVMAWIGLGVLVLVCVPGLWRLQWQSDLMAVMPGGDRVVDRYRQLTDAFGVLDAVVVEVSLADGQAAEPLTRGPLVTAADRLVDRMQDSGLFERLIYRVPEHRMLDVMAFAHAHRAALLDASDYRAIEQRLTAEAVDQAVERAHRTLLDVTGAVLAQQVLADPLGLDGLVLGKLEALSPSDARFGMIDGRIADSSRRRLLIVAVPRTRMTRTDAGRVLVERMSQWTDNVLSESPAGLLEIHWMSGHRASVDNEVMIRTDLSWMIPLTVAAIGILALLILGRWWLIFYVFIPVTIGLMSAAALFGVVDPDVAAVVMGCGTALVGIGVDYGLHVIHAWESGGQSAVRRIRRPLILAALTTGGGLLCLLASVLPAQRQMGLFGAVGMLAAAAVAAWWLGLLLPVDCHRTPVGLRGKMDRLSNRWINWQRRYGWYPALLLLVVGGLLMLGIGRLRFDGDPMAMVALSEQTAADEQAIESHWGKFERTWIMARASDRDAALAINDRLAEQLAELQSRGQVCDVVTVAPILPAVSTQRKRIIRWQSFWNASRRRQLAEQLAVSAQRRGLPARAFAGFLSSLDAPGSVVTADDWQSLGLGMLVDYRLAEMDGQWLVLSGMRPVDGVSVDSLSRRIEQTVPGTMVVHRRALVERLIGLVHQELSRLSFWAVLVVAVALLLIWARVEPVILTLIPVLFGAGMTLGILGWAGVGINMVNALFVVFVFGVGIDYSVFMLEGSLGRWSGRPDRHAGHLASVTICLLTTLCGFGALLIARHPALHSVGLTAVLGVGCCYLSAVVLLPPMTALMFPADHRLPMVGIKHWLGGLWAYGYLGMMTVFYFLVWRWWCLYSSRGDAERMGRLVRSYLRLTARGLVYPYPYRSSCRAFVSLEPDRFAESQIIVSNHRALFDVMLVLLLPCDVVMVVKQWVWRVPLLKQMIGDARFIRVDGHNSMDQLIIQAREHLQVGRSVMIFPEGTRSGDWQTARFHSGAFELSRQTGCPVHCLHMADTQFVTPRGCWWIGDHHVVFRSLGLLQPEDTEDRLSMARAARHRVSRADSEDRLPVAGSAGFRRRTAWRYAYLHPFVGWYGKVKLSVDPVYAALPGLADGPGPVVDAGCGWGLSTLILAGAAADRPVIGMDHDPAKICIARDAGAGVGHVHFVVGDLRCWSFEHVQLVVLLDVLHYWPGPMQCQIIHRVVRSLAPGGRVVFRDAVADEGLGHRVTAFSEWWSTHLGINRGGMGTCFVGEADYVAWFAQAGATVVDRRPELGLGSNCVLVFEKSGASGTKP